MKLLAWDTSAKAGALAALEWDHNARPNESKVRLVSEWALDVDTTHSERLLWSIDALLQAARWTLEEVDVFGVGVGPGSFTGLRIGITTARTLAHTLKKPLIGVSSLAALARPAALWLAEQKQRALVVASSDACKGELFALWGAASSVRDCVSLAEGDYPGLWKRGVEEKVIRPDELVASLQKKLKERGKNNSGPMRWIALGEGRHRYADAWAKLPSKLELKPPVPFSDRVQGRYVAHLAWEAHQAGLSRDALQIHPRYVRASDAELKLKAGLLPAGPTRGGVV